MCCYRWFLFLALSLVSGSSFAQIVFPSQQEAYDACFDRAMERDSIGGCVSPGRTHQFTRCSWQTPGPPNYTHGKYTTWCYMTVDSSGADYWLKFGSDIVYTTPGPVEEAECEPGEGRQQFTQAGGIPLPDTYCVGRCEHAPVQSTGIDQGLSSVKSVTYASNGKLCTPDTSPPTEGDPCIMAADGTTACVVVDPECEGVAGSMNGAAFCYPVQPQNCGSYNGQELCVPALPDGDCFVLAGGDSYVCGPGFGPPDEVVATETDGNTTEDDNPCGAGSREPECLDGFDGPTNDPAEDCETFNCKTTFEFSYNANPSAGGGGSEPTPVLDGGGMGSDPGPLNPDDTDGDGQPNVMDADPDDPRIPDDIANGSGPLDPDDLDEDGCIYADPILCDGSACLSAPWHPECAQVLPYCQVNPDDPQCDEPDFCTENPTDESCQPVVDNPTCPAGYTSQIAGGQLLCTRDTITVTVPPPDGGEPGGGYGPVTVNVDVNVENAIPTEPPATDMYTPNVERTFDSVFTAHQQRMLAAPIIASTASFFQISPMSASCPNFVMEPLNVGPATIPGFTITAWCEMPFVFDVIGLVVLIVCAWFAFRIAVL